MKCNLAVLLTLLAVSTAAESADPLGAAISLMDDLTATLEKEAAAATKAATEYAEWCKDKDVDLGFDIETGTTSKEELEATIGKMTANIEATSSKVDELAASIAQDDADLKAAESVRAKEASAFMASEAELVDSIEVLSRAFTILEREMSKNPAALLQMDTSNVQAMIKSITAVVDGAAFSSSDQKKLVALVQAQSGSDADDEELAAPAAAVYKTHSTSILDVIEDLKEKAEGQLSDLRKAELSAKQNFEMLKQSLTDSIEADEKNLAESKAAKASFAESKAAAEGDLAVTVKTLAEDKSTKMSTEQKCAQVAADHEASMKGRSEELAAIAEAKTVLSETSAGAVSQTYSFLQLSQGTGAVSQLQNHALLANVEIVNLVKKLARQQHSSALAQLASRIATIFRYGAQAGEDPFSKVKTLISDLIVKLESEASAESSEKAFCDEEIAKTEAKKSELDSDISSLTTKIDSASTKSTKLKGEVKALQAELAELASSQAEATKMRQEGHANYVTAKADLELGLSGLQKAISVLRDYFGAAAAFVQQPSAPVGYTPSTSKGSSIIEILEVVESDFAKNLATEEAEESDAAAAYEKATQEYELTKTTKTQDVKYMEKEYMALDKTVAETSADKETVSTELMSVMEYDATLKKRCVAMPETYESRKAAREAEIAGLKEALQILETETALMQRGKRSKQGHRDSFLAPF